MRIEQNNYVRIGYFTGQPSSLDPFHGFDPDSYTLITACHDGLMYIGKDGEIKPLLAKSWQRISPTCFEFELRENVQFHNSEPFDADAVVTTLMAQINPANNSPTGLGILSSIKEVEKVSEYLVKIHTHFPDSMLPWRMAMFSAIVPPQLLREKGVDYFKEYPIGAGPFIFESMNKGREISFRINENYWGDKPKVKGIKFICLPAQYWVEAIKDKKLDLIYGVHEIQLSLLKESQDIQIKSKLATLSHWFLLASKGPLLDKRVRLAMNLAIDNNMIARIHSRGTSIPQKCVGTEGQFGYNPNLNPYPYDPEKALELLIEAGYPQGFTLKGLVADHSASLVQMIAAYLEDINIFLQYEIIPRTVWMDRVPNARMKGQGIYSGDFAVAPVDNPIMYTGFHHYIFLASDGPFSLNNNPEYQKLFIEAMTASDYQENEQKLIDLDKYVHEEAMLLFTIQSCVHVASRQDIHIEISNNGHFSTYSWLSLQDNRKEIHYPEWDFDYLNTTTSINYLEFQKVFSAAEHANMFWFTGDDLSDKRLQKLVSNLQYLEQVKQSQEKFRFIQLVHFLQKVREMEGLMEASRFSGIATYNLKGEIILHNQTFSLLLGENAKSRPIDQLFLKSEHWQNFKTNLETDGGFLGSIDFLKDDSSILPVQVACSLRLDETNRTIGYLLIIRDESQERRLQKELELSYLELEKKVIERTAKLKQTLDEVEALKRQQDGDYFLTTILTNPLGQNTVDSTTVFVDFYTKQKKDFSFKNKHYELGGDINIAHQITLRDKHYVLFLNADAMGKSIQGAGGILVLGSVFQSIIERTKMNPSELNNYPERWLKIVIKEMNQVFLSFNGSMLISLVIGLVDEDCGFMYFVNIEHPDIILYRDKKASFIRNKEFLRKLGTYPLDDPIYVNTFQLHDGDMIFTGSDGKDDIQIGVDKDDNRIINEDDEEFIKRVEENNGDLENIYHSITKHGELTDDLSLLKLTYLDKQKEINENMENIQSLLTEIHNLLEQKEYEKAILELENAYKNTNNDKVFRRFIKLLVATKNYSKAIPSLEDYTFIHPENEEAIFAASYCYRKIKEYKKAIDLGERLRLRRVQMLKNMINLIELNILIGDKDRAKKIADEVVVVTEPGYARIEKLRKYLTLDDVQQETNFLPTAESLA
ncbi:MAG: SpoIIE family protein phosphatase [Leptospiraceae bacterium]|nr:SpoIIE family protein phosphatase [Leptospiraceae bacterium]MCP5494818.1 SpoIIE family protein phosphatase [Leptospiraceae bacterium]